MGRTLLYVVVAALLPVVAFSATAPTTPTYVIKWGNNGSDPAQFNVPSGVATDALGNVYVTDQSNHRVQKFDAIGNIIAQWGSFGSTDGYFNQPFGIAIDAAGDVYVVDNSNHRVQKFNAAGAYMGLWGSFGAGDGQFNQPLGIAFDATGSVYVADQSNSRVQKLTSAGIFITKWGTAGNGNGQFNTPTSVATDAAGNVYVADYANNRIQKFTSAGGFITKWGTAGNGNGQFNGPIGVAVDGAGNVYVADLGNQRIQKFTGTGGYLTKWGSLGSGNGQFNNPLGIGVDAAGNIYVAEQNNHRVQKFSSTGEALSEAPPAFLLEMSSSQATGVAVGSGGVYSTESFDQLVRRSPTGGFISNVGSGIFRGDVATDFAGNVFVANTNSCQKFSSDLVAITGFGGGGDGIATDGDGNVYVARTAAALVQKYTNTGTFVTQWGTAGIGNGQFNGLLDVAVDQANNIYTVEFDSHRVQKFTSTGAYITQWGGFGTGNGAFRHPQRLAIDAAGNVYVTDTDNNRVQKFTGAGEYITQWGSVVSPLAIAVDGAGNVYVGDIGNHRIKKFTTPPSIAFASDVRNDQGHQVRLRVKRASGDLPGSGATIPRYDVFRRSDPLAPWNQVATFSAYGESEYNVVVPTPADATAASLEYSTFMVRAATSSPSTFYDSGAANAFSFDNLSPSTPGLFQATFAEGVTHLTWGPSAAADFETFRLHRGASADFVPGPGNQIATTTDIDYADAGPAGGYYKLTAVDWHGNESPYALVSPSQSTDTPDAPAIAFALDGARPSPASGGRVLVHFALPSAEPATLELIDVTGRRVKTRNVGSLGAGRHVIDLAQGERLGPGMYFIRLSQGARERVVRTSVLN